MLNVFDSIKVPISILSMKVLFSMWWWWVAALCCEYCWCSTLLTFKSLEVWVTLWFSWIWWEQIFLWHVIFYRGLLLMERKCICRVLKACGCCESGCINNRTCFICFSIYWNVLVNTSFIHIQSSLPLIGVCS